MHYTTTLGQRVGGAQGDKVWVYNSRKDTQHGGEAGMELEWAMRNYRAHKQRNIPSTEPVWKASEAGNQQQPPQTLQRTRTTNRIMIKTHKLMRRKRERKHSRSKRRDNTRAIMAG